MGVPLNARSPYEADIYTTIQQELRGKEIGEAGYGKGLSFPLSHPIATLICIGPP